MSQTPSPPREIFVVDDDAALRQTLALLLTAAGYRVSQYADASSFLAAARSSKPACVLLDVNLPDCSGLEALRTLHAENYSVPTLMISGASDIATAVEALKVGAVDFIEKPIEREALLARVRDALPQSAGKTSDVLAQLTRRERDVLAQITAGASNKEAAQRLGISPRTVEVHRARVMEKLCARNTAHLVRIALGADDIDDDTGLVA